MNWWSVPEAEWRMCFFRVYTCNFNLPFDSDGRIFLDAICFFRYNSISTLKRESWVKACLNPS